MSNYEFWDELGKIFNAVVAYQEKTVEFNKRFINPWIRLGNVFDKQDRNEEAVDAYQKAIEIDPKNAQNWYEVGNIHFRMGKYSEAVNAFSQAIELDPEFGWPYSNLALTYVSQGKFVEAIPLYRKSIELLEDNKDKAVAWNRLGNVYRKLNEYDLAVESFQNADELDQENAGSRDNLDEQPETPTLVEATTDGQDGPAIPVTLSLSELIPAETQDAENSVENSDQYAQPVEAFTNQPAEPDQVVVEPVEAAAEPQLVALVEAEDQAADLQPVNVEVEAPAATPEAVIEESPALPESEQQIPVNVVEGSEDTVVVDEVSEPQPELAEAQVSSISPVEAVEETSVVAEVEAPVSETILEASTESKIESAASDVQPAAIEAELSTISSVEAVDESPVAAQADRAVSENALDPSVETSSENLASDDKPAAVEAENSVVSAVEAVDETPVIAEIDQAVPENAAELPQETETEANGLTIDVVDASPESAAEVKIEASSPVASDETVTVVVQTSVETFTETLTVTDTSTETSDAVLTVEKAEDSVDQQVAPIVVEVIENAGQITDLNPVDGDALKVEENSPVENPCVETANPNTDEIEVQVVVEEPVAEVTTTVIEANASVETVVDQVTTSLDASTDQPVTEQPAYEEYLKDSSDPIHIYEAGTDEEATVSQNTPASQEPVAKIDSSGDLQIEMDTKNAHVWNELGNVYYNTGAHDDAVTAYSKAIELDRWFAWPYSNLALTYVQKGRFVEAILLYQRSIELFSSEKDKAISWNRLGNVYRRINDYENAIAAYQRADELDPDNTTLSLQSRFSLLGSYVMEQKSSYVS